MPSRTIVPSRRSFLSVAGAASAFVWIPKPVKGYTAAEMRAMTVDGTVKPGVSKWELDTPALCVDLDKMEKNVATMQATLKKNGLASRPHAKTHKCAGDRQVSARHRLDRHLLRQAQRSRGDGRQRRRQDPDDDRQPVDEQDPPGDGAPEGAPATSSRRSTTSRTRATCTTPRRKRASSPTWSSTSRSARAAAFRPATARWRWRS